MNVDKVNAVMLQAITLFQQGELAVESMDEDVDLEGLEAPIARMARHVAEELDEPFDKMVDLVSDVLGEAAAHQFAGDDMSEDDLVEWVEGLNPASLSEHVSRRLAA